MDMIKKYWNNVYQYILILTPLACISAGIIYSIGKYEGWYPNTSWFSIFLFDGLQVVYLLISGYFIQHKKRIIYYTEKDIISIKTFITVSLFIQYNFIVHLFPTQDTWSCTFIFMGFVAFLFDMKLMLIHICGYTIFIVIGHLMYWEQFFPFHKEAHISILSFRILVYVLCSMSFIFVTFFVERFLLQEQQPEVENRVLLEKQLEYYQNCDLMDRELRKFHHDIKGHFVGMSYLLENKNYDELNTYFTDLRNSFENHKKLFFSGNMIIDAIVNYDLNNICASYVEISVSGSLSQIITISSIDLCSAFSNMLSNAIEAVNKCTIEQIPKLLIKFDYGSGYFSISIHNSINEEVQKNYKLNMSKKINRNHGYGINKIKSICEKYDGIFNQVKKEDMIITTIYLPR